MELVCVAHVFAGWVWGKNGPSTADSQPPGTAAKSAGWCSQTAQKHATMQQVLVGCKASGGEAGKVRSRSADISNANAACSPHSYCQPGRLLQSGVAWFSYVPG